MSIFDDLLGRSSARASNAAAADTYAKLMNAANGISAYGDQYANAYSGLSDKFSPYAGAGDSALKQLLAGLGLGGDSQAFTSAYRNLPGYEAGLDTGGRAVAANANVGNMLQSGKALKALQRFGSDYEDQRAGSYLDRLAGLAGMGQSATAQQVSTAGQGLQGQLATRQSAFSGQSQAAPVIGQGMVAGEQAKQGALTNLMNTAAYLGGAYLGGPGFAALRSPRATRWGGSDSGGG